MRSFILLFCKNIILLYKTIKESISSNVVDIVILEKHSKGTQRALENSSTLALRHSRYSRHFI